MDFYRGSTLLGSATASPYSFTWSSAPAGSYTLTAVAADADSGTSTSAAVSITVQPPNQPPAVTLTSPANGATFTAPATITLSASASDPENRLTRVDFYRGSTLLGSATANADGGTKTSTAVSITVSAASSTTHVMFTASADHDSTVTDYLLEVFANGADPNTSSAVASKNLGKPTPDASREIAVDQTSFFSALSPGSYTATVAAVGADGMSRSTPVTYTR